MDITKSNFSAERIRMLQMIVTSDFVAIECEFTGLTRKPKGSVTTIQERYEHGHEDTSNFTIFEFGLTSVKIDKHQEKFVLLPFNVPLAPFCHYLTLESIPRSFSISSLGRLSTLHLLHQPPDSAAVIPFLFGGTNKLATALDDGVPYLSRQEYSNAEQFWDKVPETGVAANTELLDRVRKDLHSWNPQRQRVDGKKEVTDFLIASNKSGPMHSSMHPLTKIEKHCVQHLVKMHFPHYRAEVEKGQEGLLRMVLCSTTAKRSRKAATNRMKLDIRNQNGLRLVLETLAAGNDEFEHLLHEEIDDLMSKRETVVSRSTNEESDVVQANAEMSKRETMVPKVTNGESEAARTNVELDPVLVELQSIKRTKPSVLVGHNMLLDLMYIYRTFFGTLPETFEEFCHAIHEVFPTFIDTKCMMVEILKHTDRARDMGAQTNLNFALRTLLKRLPQAIKSRITLDSRHDKYSDDKEMVHEAGFDSMNTAKLLIYASQYMKNMTGLQEPDLKSLADMEDAKFDFPDWDDPFWAQFKNKIVFGQSQIIDFDAIREGRQRV